jgi:hypothetical protein
MMCIIACFVTTILFTVSLWRNRKSFVDHSSGLGSEGLTNAIFSFLSKCKLRCADVPAFSKDGLVKISHEMGWPGLVVAIQVT